MGNDQSQSSNRMALSAMATVMKLTKSELINLRNKCVELSSSPPADPDENPQKTTTTGLSITRDNFRVAMTDVAIVEDSDSEVLDRLFTMWDKEGEDTVNPILFLVGCSPLATWKDVPFKLRFAFQVFDVEGTGRISHGDLVSVLSSINATASYFGDAVLTLQQIEIIVEDVFNSATDMGAEISFEDNVDKLAVHPLVVQFVSGAGTTRYGTEK